MNWFTSLNLESLYAVFIRQIKCLYDIEIRLVDAFAHMRDAAMDPELKAGFDAHLSQTRVHVERLEQIFHLCQIKAERVTASAMKAMVSEADSVISTAGDASVRDAALVACGQAIEHHEIALYGTARSWAIFLGLQQVSEVLEATVQEETATDHSLTWLAERGINAHAAHEHSV